MSTIEVSKSINDLGIISSILYDKHFNNSLQEKNISYNNYLIEKKDDKDKIMDILEGGKKSFVNRDRKYGNVLGEIEYGDN